MGRACRYEPNEIKKNTHPKNITAPFGGQVNGVKVAASTGDPSTTPRRTEVRHTFTGDTLTIVYSVKQARSFSDPGCSTDQEQAGACTSTASAWLSPSVWVTDTVARPTYASPAVQFHPPWRSIRLRLAPRTYDAPAWGCDASYVWARRTREKYPPERYHRSLCSCAGAGNATARSTARYVS